MIIINDISAKLPKCYVQDKLFWWFVYKLHPHYFKQLLSFISTHIFNMWFSFYFSYNYPYWYKMLCLFMLTHSFYHMQFESCLQNSAVLFLVMWWNVNKSFKLIDTSIIYINNGKIIHFIKLSNMGPNSAICISYN